MNNCRLLFLLCVVSFFFSSCHDSGEEIERLKPREQVGRTVLAYIVGDSGDSYNELSELFEENFDAMKRGMEKVDYSKCNLVVYSEMVDSAPCLISLKKREGRVVADTILTYPEQNPLDKKVMSSVIAQTVQYFPADSYGFVFLSHSTSWFPASKDANSRSVGLYRRMEMNIPDFHEALQTFPEPLKFILFDSCLMQAVEVAYELRDCAEYFIGSPTEIPGPGAPYDKVVPEMFGDVDCARRIAAAYFDEYARNYTGEVGTDDRWVSGVSVSALKSSALDELALLTKDVFQSVGHMGNLSKEGIQRYDWSRDDANYDLKGFVCSILGENNNLFARWRIAFDNAMVYWNTTEKNYSGLIRRMFPMTNASGLSVYIPDGSYDSFVNQYYRTLQWYAAVGWNKVSWE